MSKISVETMTTQDQLLKQAENLQLKTARATPGSAPTQKPARTASEDIHTDELLVHLEQTPELVQLRQVFGSGLQRKGYDAAKVTQVAKTLVAATVHHYVKTAGLTPETARASFTRTVVADAVAAVVEAETELLGSGAYASVPVAHDQAIALASSVLDQGMKHAGLDLMHRKMAALVDSVQAGSAAYRKSPQGSVAYLAPVIAALRQLATEADVVATQLDLRTQIL